MAACESRSNDPLPNCGLIAQPVFGSPSIAPAAGQPFCEKSEAAPIKARPACPANSNFRFGNDAVRLVPVSSRRSHSRQLIVRQRFHFKCPDVTDLEILKREGVSRFVRNFTPQREWNRHPGLQSVSPSLPSKFSNLNRLPFRVAVF